MGRRVCLVTGATSGIGRATAMALAGMGADVGIVARDRTRGEATVAELRALGGLGDIDLFVADLSSQAQVRALAADVRDRWDLLHVLINCAGAFYRERRETVDGLERTFALNHLAYFLLTTSLLDLVVASAPSRIINVTSGAQSVGRIDFDDLQKKRQYRGQSAYNQSKLANVLFTYELARRLESTGVTANCVHPGVVRSGFGRRDASSVAGDDADRYSLHARPRQGRGDGRLPRLVSRNRGRHQQVLPRQGGEEVVGALLRPSGCGAAVEGERALDIRTDGEGRGMTRQRQDRPRLRRESRTQSDPCSSLLRQGSPCPGRSIPANCGRLRNAGSGGISTAPP